MPRTPDDDLPGSPDLATPALLERRALFRGGAALLAGSALAGCGTRSEPQPRAGSAAGSGSSADAGAGKPSNAALAVEAERQARAAADAAENAPAVELIELTFADLLARQDKGGDTAASLVAKYQQRIEALDRNGPKLASVLEVDRDAPEIAKQLDAERVAGKHHGPLHGLPILLKDNIDTGDNMTTTAGSLALEGSRAQKDAFVAGKLREAGAILLGKTNLSEWANFRGKASVSGWSGRGGQCRNPYALDRSPLGSSSGSAVAVAASLCAAAIGSETDGSIVAPASVCGIVGLKPTLGLVSRAGVLPLAPSQDTLGPMARTVTDVALLLNAIAGPDPDDPATTAPHKARPTAPGGNPALPSGSPGEAGLVDYTKALDPKALAGARLGVPRKGFWGVHRGVDALMNAALADLKEAGAILVEPAELEMPPGLEDAELEVLVTEMKVYLDRYLAARSDARVHSIADAIAFNAQNRGRELALFGQEWFEQAVTRKGLSDKAYVDARARCAKAAQLLDKVLADQKLDAFVAPTNTPACLIDPANGDYGGLWTSTLPAIAGYPHITVPAGQFRGLPVGLSFFGPAFSERKLLGFAYAYEQHTKHRRQPRYLPTIELTP